MKVSGRHLLIIDNGGPIEENKSSIKNKVVDEFLRNEETNSKTITNVRKLISIAHDE